MAKFPEYPADLNVQKLREPERRTFREVVKGVLDFDERVTFTQVGWMVHHPPEFVPLNVPLPVGVSFSPLWVEGPNE